MDTNPNHQQWIELRNNVQRFVKLFGLLQQNVTPCGCALSVSQVYALQELETGTLSITELASRLDLERSSVSRLADELVKSGFVQREVNEANRRETLLSLTDKGVRASAQVREQSIAFFRRVLGDLPAADQAQIRDGLSLFTGALARYRGRA